jgi:hypothetical protein
MMSHDGIYTYREWITEGVDLECNRCSGHYSKLIELELREVGEQEVVIGLCVQCCWDLARQMRHAR